MGIAQVRYSSEPGRVPTIDELAGYMFGYNTRDAALYGLRRVSGVKTVVRIGGPGTGTGDTFDLYTSNHSRFPIEYLVKDRNGISEVVTAFLKPYGLLEGGIVTWVEDMDFIVTSAFYAINGNIIVSPDTVITINPADDTYPRIDVVVADISGEVNVITGTAAENPVVPHVNPAQYVQLAQILVPEGTTSFGGIVTRLIVYDENVEWATGASPTLLVNFEYLINPFHELKCINITGIDPGEYVNFIADAPISFVDYQYLILAIKLKDSTNEYTRVTAMFYYHGDSVGSAIEIPVDIESLEWQQAYLEIIPDTYKSNKFDEIRFEWDAAPDYEDSFVGFYLDFIRLEKGFTTPPGSKAIILVGDVIGTGVLGEPVNTQLAEVNEDTGTFGSSTKIPKITVDAKGRVVAVEEEDVAGGQTITVVDNILDMDIDDGEISAIPYTARVSPDPGYPYLYRHSDNPTYVGNLLKLDGSMMMNDLNLVNTSEAPVLEDISPVSWNCGARWVDNGNETYTHSSGTGSEADNTLSKDISVISNAFYIIKVSVDNTNSFSSAFIFTFSNQIQDTSDNTAHTHASFTSTTTGTITVSIRCPSTVNGSVTEIKIYRLISEIKGSLNVYGSDGNIGTEGIFSNRNIVLGKNNFNKFISTNDNVSIGHYILEKMVAGSHNVVIGRTILQEGSYIRNTVAIGNSVLSKSKTLNNIVSLGHGILSSAESASGVISIGNLLLGSVVKPISTIAIGFSIGNYATSTTYSVLIGSSIANNTASLSSNYIMGYYVSPNASSILNSVLMGRTVRGTSTGSISSSVLIGYSLSSSGSGNISNSVMIGSTVATNLKSGTHTLIGANTAAGGNNSLLGLYTGGSVDYIHPMENELFLTILGAYSSKANISTILSNLILLGHSVIAYKPNSTIIGNYAIKDAEIRGNLKLFNMAEFGDNILSNPTFISGTGWYVTGDCSLNNDRVEIVKVLNSGTIRQNTSDFISPIKPNRWYRLTINARGIGYIQSGDRVTLAGSISSETSSFNNVIYGSTTSGIMIMNYYFRTPEDVPDYFEISIQDHALRGNMTLLVVTEITLHEVIGGDLFVNKDIKQRLGQYQYHLQNEDQLTVGDWRTYFDASGMHMEKCTDLSPETWTEY